MSRQADSCSHPLRSFGKLAEQVYQAVAKCDSVRSFRAAALTIAAIHGAIAYGRSPNRRRWATLFLVSHLEASSDSARVRNKNSVVVSTCFASRANESS